MFWNKLFKIKVQDDTFTEWITFLKLLFKRKAQDDANRFWILFWTLLIQENCTGIHRCCVSFILDYCCSRERNNMAQTQFE